MESESEVLGIPQNPRERKWILDKDPGRAEGRIKEKVDFYVGSIKTPGLRNLNYTKPYMHNGAFNSLEEVMDFYNKGGGAGNGLTVPHQTLSDEPLNLSKAEQRQIIAFMQSLNEDSIPFKAPLALPLVEGVPELANRKPGGEY